MKLFKENTDQIFIAMRNGTNANQLMGWYDSKEKLNDPVLNDIAAKVKRIYPELFPAMGILHLAITGTIIDKDRDGSFYHAKIPHDVMSQLLMDTFYFDIHVRSRWHDDRDYRRQEDWDRTSFLANCDGRTIDPSYTYGMYANFKYGFGNTYPAMLYMEGGSMTNEDHIIADINEIIDSFYSDPMMRQDIKKEFKSMLPKYIQDFNATVRAKEFFQAFPSLKEHWDKLQRRNARGEY